MESFSDDVFGFAITLLAVSLAIRPPGRALQQLLRGWLSYVAYLISFLTIGGGSRGPTAGERDAGARGSPKVNARAGWAIGRVAFGDRDIALYPDVGLRRMLRMPSTSTSRARPVTPVGRSTAYGAPGRRGNLALAAGWPLVGFDWPPSRPTRAAALPATRRVSGADQRQRIASRCNLLRWGSVSPQRHVW